MPSKSETNANIDSSPRIHPFVFSRANRMTAAASAISPIPMNDTHIFDIGSIEGDSSLIPYQNGTYYIIIGGK
jgi:hypothetical protein